MAVRLQYPSVGLVLVWLKGSSTVQSVEFCLKFVSLKANSTLFGRVLCKTEIPVIPLSAEFCIELIWLKGSSNSLGRVLREVVLIERFWKVITEEVVEEMVFRG